MLTAPDVLLFAVDNVTPAEAHTINALGLQSIGLAEVKRDLQDAANRALAWAAPFSRLLIHLDIDVLDYTDFPIAQNVRRCNGLTFDELSRSSRDCWRRQTGACSH